MYFLSLSDPKAFRHVNCKTIYCNAIFDLSRDSSVNQLNASDARRQNIAIIGTGIAGMSCAWLLNQGHNITVYEQNDRIGGHSNTVEVPTKYGFTPVDTGFIVYNERNYPNLTALFKHLNVPTIPSEMSFSASLDGGMFEYSGTDLNGILGQRMNIFRPRFWRMIADLLRFYREAPAMLKDTSVHGMSLGDYLSQENYGQSFIHDHLLPMGAAIWSTTPAEMKAFPVISFLRFFDSHGLLGLSDRPQWRVVTGGSREYVTRLTTSYRGRIHFGGVRSIRRAETEVLVTDHQGIVSKFDHVVIASHADEALKMLSDPDSNENRLLGSWRYTRNRAVLHRDPSLMPTRQRVWSSWNYIGNRQQEQTKQFCVTYWMNRLQSLNPDEPLFVTLNPIHEPAPRTIIREFDYRHPFFDAKALEAQRLLWSLQGNRRTWFCGSYFGHGFHEDALQSGLAVAEQLGSLRRPWRVLGENNRLTFAVDGQEKAA